VGAPLQPAQVQLGVVGGVGVAARQGRVDCRSMSCPENATIVSLNFPRRLSQACLGKSWLYAWKIARPKWRFFPQRTAYVVGPPEHNIGSGGGEVRLKRQAPENQTAGSSFEVFVFIASEYENDRWISQDRLGTNRKKPRRGRGRGRRRGRGREGEGGAGSSFALPFHVSVA
jgi:hypothetical protein